jgi:uncharacterized protein
MKFKAIKGKKGIVTDVKDATYVEAARWGKCRGWRYVVGLVVILFAWLVVGTVGNALDGQEGSVGSFLVIMAGFTFFLAGILLAVSLVHHRPLQTLIAAREKIS